MKGTRFLSGHKCLFVIAVCALFIFSACAAQQDTGLAFAIEQGLILPQEELAGGTLSPHSRIIEPQPQDLITQIDRDVQVHFPTGRVLSFIEARGSLDLHVTEGQFVREGDMLAQLIAGTNFDAELAHFEAIQRLQNFDTNFATERERQLAEIANARADGQSALQIQRLEAASELFSFRNQAGRDALAAEVAALAAVLDGEIMYAPFDGVITYITNAFTPLAPLEITIVEYEPIFFLLSAPATGGRAAHFDLLRNGDIVTINTIETDNDEIPILSLDARVVTDTWASGARSGFGYGLVPVDLDGLMDDLRALNPNTHPLHTLFNTAFRTDIQVFHAIDTIVLPEGAIRDEQPNILTTNSYVFVYDNGVVGRRYVQTGARAGGQVQVIYGIEAGERVVVMP